MSERTDFASKVALPLAGHIFESKYRIEDMIGSGGYARVYRATFEDVGRKVAIKILMPQPDQPNLYNSEIDQRFLREAQLISDLRSPNTITLHDFGRASNGLLYMVFEYIDGIPLDRLVWEQGPMSAERAAHVLRQVLHSLREAHTVGILHRDIKPGNIMLFDWLGERDNVKVLDFGIAKQWTHQSDGRPIQPDLTEDGTIVGTPRYMSPEQICGQQLAPSTDIYSLGLVAWELLTGQQAVPYEERAKVVRRHLGPEPFILPVGLAPAGLTDAVHRMLAKDKALRFQNADSVLKALEHWDAPQVAQPFDPSVADAAPAPRRSNPTPFYNPSPVVVGGGPQASASVDPTEPSALGAVPQPGFPGANATPIPTPAQTGPGVPATAGPGVGVPPGFGSGVPAGFGTGAPASAVQQPANTFLKVQATPTEFRLDVPVKPTLRNLGYAGLAGIFLVLTVITNFLPIVVMFAAAAVFLVTLSLVFRSIRLVMNVQTGYEVTSIVITYERSKRGPMTSVVRLQASGQDDLDNTVLKLVTHDGEVTVASGFTDAENKWAAAAANQWLEQVRAAAPNPVQLTTSNPPQ